MPCKNNFGKKKSTDILIKLCTRVHFENQTNGMSQKVCYTIRYVSNKRFNAHAYQNIESLLLAFIFIQFSFLEIFHLNSIKCLGSFKKIKI